MEEFYSLSPKTLLIMVAIFCVIISILTAIFYAHHRHEQNQSFVPVKAISSSCTFERFPVNPRAYLLIRCYNIEGGLFWHLHNVVIAAYVANMYDMQLIVLFDEGFYVEKNPKFLEQHGRHSEGGNWFDYFFEPLGEELPQIKQRLSRKRNYRSFGSVGWGHGKHLHPGAIVEFTRETFDLFNSRMPSDFPWKTIFNTYLRPKPHVQKLVNDYYAETMMGKYNIGIHWRGTDKYGDGNDNEDSPRHFEYQWMSNRLKEYLEGLSWAERTSARLLVCTDESPFITHMKATFGDIVHYTDAIRSPTNTGGLHLDGSVCHSENDYCTIPACKEIRNLREASVHRGFQDKSAYQKGIDVILDVLLLSRCKKLFLSRGNVSSWADKLSNGDNIDMVKEYESRD